MVALFDTCHPFPDLFDDARPFMTKHDRQRQRERSVDDVPIAMA